MRSLSRTIGLLGLWLLLACSGPGPASAETPGYDTDAVWAERLRQKALTYEKQDELPAALFTWRAAALLEPGRQGVPRIIADLEQTIDRAAQHHFKEAEEHYRAGRLDEARRQFLIVLRLNPRNQRAARYLRYLPVGRRATRYTVRAGDSFTRIARNAYGDGGLAGLLAAYNDLDPRRPLLIGKLLWLPSVGGGLAPTLPNEDQMAPVTDAQMTERPQIQDDPGSQMRTAVTYMDQKAYTQAIEILEHIVEHDPGQTAAWEQLQAARYAWGRELIETPNRESEALELLDAVDPNYKDAAQWQALARGRLTARAEALYRKGVKLFLNEHLEEAAAVWRQALILNPDHPKARQDMENALRLLDHWHKLERDASAGSSANPPHLP